VPHTVIFFHAHPDDEALLTSGTMAQLSEQGHRVVLVVATDGDAGLSSAEVRQDGRLGDQRLAELRRSADAVGVDRLEVLGFADSGLAHPSATPAPSPATSSEPTAPQVVQQASAAAAYAQTQVENTQLFSPLDGVVLSHNIEPGEFVAPGTPVVTVADRGPGVPADALARLFDRFYKADPSRGGAPGGSSGLGLAIAAEHAALLGGSLRARNRPGGGLIVALTLPVTGSLPPADTEDTRGAEAGRMSKPAPGTRS